MKINIYSMLTLALLIALLSGALFVPAKGEDMADAALETEIPEDAYETETAGQESLDDEWVEAEYDDEADGEAVQGDQVAIQEVTAPMQEISAELIFMMLDGSIEWVEAGQEIEVDEEEAAQDAEAEADAEETAEIDAEAETEVDEDEAAQDAEPVEEDTASESEDAADDAEDTEDAEAGEHDALTGEEEQTDEAPEETDETEETEESEETEETEETEADDAESESDEDEMAGEPEGEEGEESDEGAADGEAEAEAADETAPTEAAADGEAEAEAADETAPTEAGDNGIANAQVTISASWKGQLMLGSEVTLTMTVAGAEGDYVPFWEVNYGDGEWTRLDGVNTFTHSFTLDAQTAGWNWRGGIEAAPVPVEAAEAQNDANTEL